MYVFVISGSRMFSQELTRQCQKQWLLPHTDFFFFYCMKLICDAKYTLYNTGCTLTFQVHVSECWWGLFFGWLCTSITCGFIHFSVMNLQICIGIILICRCIIIQSNHEIKTCFTFFSLKIEQYSNKTI